MRIARVFLPALAALLLVRSAPVDAPEPQAASTPAAPSVDCRDPLPLPADFPTDISAYEKILGNFLQAKCYEKLGWARDRQLRVTGPTVATIGTSGTDPHLPAWTTTTWGMHNTVLIYYSPDVFRWMCETEAAGKRRYMDQCRAACPNCQLDGKGVVRPIADGSMILKEMYGNTTQAILDDPDPKTITNRPGMALMVKDSRGSKDGWFWGAWVPYDQLPQAKQLDWPPPVNFPYPWMGFGYYCVNCHGSANNGESTYSDLSHIYGDPNEFTKYYFQDQPPLLTTGVAAPVVARETQHEKVNDNDPTKVTRVSQPRWQYLDDFLKTFSTKKLVPPTWSTIARLAMAPEPYDHVVSRPDGAPMFLTSDQCVSCHASGATGMHFDMTVQSPQQPPFHSLLNLAPYGEWRGSPMGLAGRDPIFFAQLESERKLHSGLQDVVQDLCLHCHGVMGQRQFCMDQFSDPKRANEVCNNSGLLGLDRNSRPIVKRELFKREMLNAIPYKADAKELRNSRYGALARDGVSCTVCHHLDIDHQVPFGHTFTGDFIVGDPSKIHGPFEVPKVVPMEHALGLTPVDYPRIRDSEICGSCHSVVLPVFDGSKPYIRPGETEPEVIIEQATYPEWVFSEFSDGATKRSCQDCHMKTEYPGLQSPKPLSFKIAQIQEASNMPQVENRRPMEEIDLPFRSPYGRHTLVGLNVFFNKFAQQFPDVLGIRVQDPMLVGHGIAPLQTTFDSMVQQADTETANLIVEDVKLVDNNIVATVAVENLAGHKFPSGVGFRRLFIEFSVLDANGTPIWTSGRTTPTGVIVDENGKPVKGEFFWKSDCRPMTAAEQANWFQPHYENITAQNQVQIYQELVQDPRRKFTTSFLSLANPIKDNRILPKGWRPSVELAERRRLGSPKLPARELVEDVLPHLPDGRGGSVHDPYYLPKSEGGLGGGGDRLTYTVSLSGLSIPTTPASVQATLFYQAIPPFYLQDRFCTTPEGADTSRLFFLAGHVDFDKTRVENWKLMVKTTGPVPIATPATSAAQPSP